MGNKLKDEDLHLNIIVNGDKGKKELGDLEKSTRELTTRNKELRAEKEKLIRAGKEESDRFKEVTREMRENNRVIKANETRMTELRKEIGVTGLTMKQLRSEQIRLKRLMDSATFNTPQWEMYRAELDKVEAQMSKVRAGGKRMQLSIGKIADGFNRFSVMGAAAIATITGLLFSVKNFISGMVELDDQIADVRKTTGLTSQQVRELYQDFRTLNTRTPRKELLLLAEEAGRLGKKSKQDVMDFVEVANQIKVALGDDLGGEASVAIREVGKLTNIYRVGEEYGTDFKESMLKVGSAINEVSANSNAQAPYLIEYLKRMGGVADQADIGAASILGYGSALDQLGQREEMAATAVGKVIVDMFTDTAKYAAIAEMNVGDFSELLRTDANAAFLKLLEGLNGSNEGFSVMAKKLDELGLDGNRAVQVLSALASNTEIIRREQALANKAMDEGVSLTNEYNIKNNNLAASWSKLGQYIHSKFINSGFLGWLEGIVGKAAEWTEIPLAETLREQQQEVNELTIEMTNANTPAERRNEIYEELKSLAPDVIANIDKENISVSTLRENLQKYNEVMIKKLALQDSEVALQEQREKAGEATAERLEKESQLMTEFYSIVQQANKRGADYTDQLQEIILSDDDLINKTAKINELLGKQRVHYRTNAEVLTNQVITAREKEKEATEDVNEALEEYQKKYQLLFGSGSGDGNGPKVGDKKTIGNTVFEWDGNEWKKVQVLGGGGGKADPLTVLDEAHAERLNLLVKQYEQEAWTADRYRSEQLAAELAYLETKRALYEQSGEETGDIDEKIASTRIDLQNQLNKVLAEGDKELFAALEEDSKAVDKAAAETIKVADNAIKTLENAAAREARIMEQRRQTYVQFAQTIGVSFGQIMADSEASFGTYLRNTLVMALEALHQFLLIEKAKAIIKSATEGAPINPIAVAKAIAKVALMEIAYQGVKGAIMRGGSKREGGFGETGASDNDVAGVYHMNEFIANANAVRNPEVKQFLDVFDYYQRTGQISNLNTQTIMASIPTIGKMASGGFSNQTSTASPNYSGSTQTFPAFQSDPELVAAIKQLNEYLKEPLKATVNKYGTNGLEEAFTDIEEFKSKVFKS